MIKYEAGTMGISFIFQLKGSVFPKALLWALPNAILAVFMHYYGRGQDTLNMAGVNMLWSGYTSVLGFLVVFRNNQAYTRFWEGATLINQVRGEWFNAVSTLFAFCNHSKDVQSQVETFQHTLIRLASMLYCSALQQVCDLQDDTLEIIDNSGMDPDSLNFMSDCNDRCEILLQWMQRLIVESEEAKTIKIAPPLLTRAFQELSRGIVNLNNARKIKDIPFPFPYAQMITCMMMVHWLVTPLFASQVIESVVAAAAVCFCVTFSFWCLIYITLEIDQPFGDDANDLPLREMQCDFNQSLLNLMHHHAQKVPVYTLSDERWHTQVSKSDATLPRSNSKVMNGSTPHYDAEQLVERTSPKQAPCLQDSVPVVSQQWVDSLHGPQGQMPMTNGEAELGLVDISLAIEPTLSVKAVSSKCLAGPHAAGQEMASQRSRPTLRKAPSGDSAGKLSQAPSIHSTGKCSQTSQALSNQSAGKCSQATSTCSAPSRGLLVPSSSSAVAAKTVQNNSTLEARLHEPQEPQNGLQPTDSSDCHRVDPHDRREHSRGAGARCKRSTDEQHPLDNRAGVLPRRPHSASARVARRPDSPGKVAQACCGLQVVWQGTGHHQAA